MRTFLVVATFLAAGAVWAQDIPYTIETEGVATVDVAPTYAEFWVSATLTGASVTEAMYKAVAFEDSLRAELNTRELRPTVIETGSAAITNIAQKQVRVTTRLQFPGTTFNNTDTGATTFAALVDDLAETAAKLQGEVTGPVLNVEDTLGVQQAAIQQAIEKAYPVAKSAADIMNGQIVAVGKINVVSVVWNDTAGTPVTLPDTRRMTCTAHVRVTYLFSAV